MLKALLSFFAFSSFVSLAYTAPAIASKKSIWDISIFRGPAPPPSQGPPVSANALRDPSKLKFELVGIFCAYLVWIALTALAVLLVKRRLRRRHESSSPSLRMDTTKPIGQVTLREIDAGPKSPLSPKSPGRMASIRSWARREKQGRQSMASLSTVNTKIDERVVDNDRAKNMDDMAKLYAAVMIHDEERSADKSRSSAGSSPVSEDNTPITPKSPVYPGLAHPAYLPPVPQAYPQHYHQENAHDSYSQNIYPHQSYTQEAYEPMAPPPPPAPLDNDRQSLLENQTSPPRKGKPTALSLSSRLGSSQSNKARPSPITIRGQPISKPLGSADLRQSVFSASQTSVHSSVYSPGPPPPTPGRAPPTVVEEIEMHGRPQIISPGPPTSDSSFNNSSKALPFRQFYQDSLRSAPPTKTTFLDRRATLNAPKTGVPKTPYSPYCPTTPMTPITPRRLLGKEELKKNKKQYALKMVKENDMVQSDNDMWGTD